MAQAPSRKYSAGWATLPLFFPQRALAGRSRYLAQIPWIDRDSSLQQMDVRVATIGCSRWHHASKLVANIDARCRGPLLWKGGAKESYRPARWTKAANLVLCMRLLSQGCRNRVEVRRGRGHH